MRNAFGLWTCKMCGECFEKDGGRAYNYCDTCQPTRKRTIRCIFCGGETMGQERTCLKCCPYLLDFRASIHRKEGRESVRDRVRARDNYTCKDCGVTRTPEFVWEHNSKIIGSTKGKIKSLDVHHLNGECGKKSRSYDRLESMGGLITLCHKCHYNRPEHRINSQEFRDKITKLPKDKYDEVISLRKQGYTLREIGVVFEVSGERIRQILNSVV